MPKNFITLLFKSKYHIKARSACSCASVIVVLPIVRVLPLAIVNPPFYVDQSPMSCLCFQLSVLVLPSAQSCPVFQFTTTPLPLGSCAYPTFQFTDSTPVPGLESFPFSQSSVMFPPESYPWRSAHFKHMSPGPSAPF